MAARSLNSRPTTVLEVKAQRPMARRRHAIEDAIDRLHEAHWWIHQMEEWYHDPDPFRYSLNSFLRALKEVPDILRMAMQNAPGFPSWFRERIQIATQDPLVSRLFKHRDVLVHKRMLLPVSIGAIGITELRGMKFGMSTKVDPFRDSDELMVAYLVGVAEKRDQKRRSDFLEILRNDDDSLPCVQRVWRLNDIAELEAVELAARAWVTVGTLVYDTLVWAGRGPLPVDLSCRHSAQRVQFRLYPREWLEDAVRRLRGGEDIRAVRDLLRAKRYGPPPS